MKGLDVVKPPTGARKPGNAGLIGLGFGEKVSWDLPVTGGNVDARAGEIGRGVKCSVGCVGAREWSGLLLEVIPRSLPREPFFWSQIASKPATLRHQGDDAGVGIGVMDCWGWNRRIFPIRVVAGAVKPAGGVGVKMEVPPLNQ